MNLDEAIDRVSLCPNEAERVLLAEVKRLRESEAERKAVIDDALTSEVERLRKELAKLGDHPSIMEQGGTSDVDRALRVISKLEGKLRLSEEDRVDAKRYRWLRDTLHWVLVPVSNMLSGSNLDAKTDEAMATKPNQEVNQ